MVITEKGKVILAAFVDPERKERSKEEATILIEDWMEATGFYGMGASILLKLNTDA